MADSPYIVVATPCYGGQSTVAYVNSVLALQRSCLERGVKINFNFRTGEALITRARADMVGEFLATEATHLLFIDSISDLRRSRCSNFLTFDADVTAAAYPFKRIDWEKVRKGAQDGRIDLEAVGLDYVFYPESRGPMTARNDFVRVRHTGTGFLMIRRPALIRMCEAYPELRYKMAQRTADLLKDGPYSFALFECMIESENGALFRQKIMPSADAGGISVERSGSISEAHSPTTARTHSKAILPSSSARRREWRPDLGRPSRSGQNAQRSHARKVAVASEERRSIDRQRARGLDCVGYVIVVVANRNRPGACASKSGVNHGGGLGYPAEHKDRRGIDEDKRVQGQLAKISSIRAVCGWRALSPKSTGTGGWRQRLLTSRIRLGAAAAAAFS